MPTGYVKVRVGAVGEVGGSDVVLLFDEVGQRIVPIVIGGTEALSINLRMHAEAPPRPLTHDLLDSMLRRMRASVVKVQVDELRDGVFIGSVFVREADGYIFKLDSRASDAIALAVGNRVPVYVARPVLDEAGIGREELEKSSGGSGTYSLRLDQRSRRPSESAWRKYFRVTFQTSHVPPEPTSTHGV